MATGSFAPRGAVRRCARRPARLAASALALALGACAADGPWYGSLPAGGAAGDAATVSAAQGPTPTPAVWPTVTMPDLFARLARGEDQAELIADVRVFGLAAAPTQADIEALQAAGASPTLLDAVRDALLNPGLAVAPPAGYGSGAAYPPAVGDPPGAYPPVWEPYPTSAWWPFAFGLGWIGGSRWYGPGPRPPYPPPGWRPGVRPPPPGAGPRPGFGAGPKPVPVPRPIPYKGRR